MQEIFIYPIQDQVIAWRVERDSSGVGGTIVTEEDEVRDMVLQAGRGTRFVLVADRRGIWHRRLPIQKELFPKQKRAFSNLSGVVMWFYMIIYNYADGEVQVVIRYNEKRPGHCNIEFKMQEDVNSV